MGIGQKSVTSALVRRGMQSALRLGMDIREFQKLTEISEAEANQIGGRVAGVKYISMLNLIERLPEPVNLAIPGENDYLLEPFSSTIAVVSNAPNLIIAFEKCIELRAVIGEIDGMSFRQSGAQFQFDFLLDGSERTPLMALNSFGGVIKLAERYGGTKLQTPIIELVGPESPTWKNLVSELDCRVIFGKNSNRLTFSAPHATLRFPQHNELLFKIFSSKADFELRRLRENHSFQFKVETFLISLFSNGNILPFENNILLLTCQEFGLSRSALHRRLQQEDTNFQNVIARVRINEAKRLLIENRMQLSEIGDVLGFSSPSVFSRFFSDQAGISPSRFKFNHVDGRPVSGN
ncbi:Helix-turn-helix domain-containing protein [Paraburkholderia fungorum]|uniref:Helix-turn-helix domain-containing protein n=1 Tax=Paraburkholderia fungorum TaxID=134537 RepID=A0A1H1JNW3_9BURK|nr:AraC family transcriptional regulator [Paraburkholderia fungorum]SDR51683.1 Helix-turn-helix domain-containing protein [Paraburkholderia fungorum]